MALLSEANEVLRHYPLAPEGDRPVAQRGGFSGARVWRVGGLCLRAWPQDGPAPDRLGAKLSRVLHTVILHVRAHPIGVRFLGSIAVVQATCGKSDLIKESRAFHS